MYKMVLMRHGDSTWKLKSRFSGWADVALSSKGLEDVKIAGRVLEEIDQIRLSIKHFYLACPETIVAAAAVANQGKAKS